MEKLVLIDGNSLINRAYFALPPLNNPQGVQVQAVFGFANMLVKTIEKIKPEYIAVAFDVHAPTFRHKMYSGYKSRRKGMPDDLAAQMPILKQMLDVIGIKRFELPGYEADDIIGTLSKRFDVCSYIVTGDRDSFQLINDNTKVLFTKRGITEVEETDENVLLERYGLTPAGVIEYKSLAGDQSDDIPGVKGVGEKSALQLLKTYGGIDGIYSNINSITSEALKKKLIEGKESAYLSHTLATINTQAPLDCELSDCRYTFPFNSEVFNFFESQGFKSLIKRGELFNTENKPLLSGHSKAEKIEIRSIEDIKQTINGVKAFSLYFTESEFRFATDDKTEYSAGLKYDLLSFGLSEYEIISALKEALVDSSVTKTVLDSKSFITHVYKNYKFMPCGFFDVKLAQYVVDSTVPHNTLSDLCEAYSIDGEDCATGLWFMYDKLKADIAANNLTALYYDIELPLVNVLFEMEQTGFTVNRARLDEIGEAFVKEEAILTKQIYAEAGKEFNIKSPRQLATVLFEDLGIPYPKKGTKVYNTGAEILEQLDSSYKIVPLVLRYRFITKLNSTYIDGLKKLLAPDGTVHTEFRQTLTTTGRLSSVEPNLQNIPVREEDGKILRSLFVAREGYTLVSADYSQIELRIMAHYSQDPTMLEAYKSGEDIHARTAAQVFGVPIDKVTPDMRRTAKTVNFGIIYGISDYGLASNLKISRAEAKTYINNYFERFKKVREYLDECVADAKKVGYVSTLFGRKRKIPELYSPIYFTRQFAERAAMNMPLQGTAADIIKIAMINVNNALKGLKSRLILQVHDELIVETADDELEKVKALLKDKMENAYTLDVPLVVDISEGKSWFDCK